MATDEKKEKCFKRAEVELLSVIHWMEQCRKEHEMEKLLDDATDIYMIIDAVANLQANTKKLEMMFSSLFMLSKTYNKQYASYLGRDRIDKVMESFDNLKDTVGELKQAMPELKNIPIGLPNKNVTDIHYYQEKIVTIDEPECSIYPEDIFEKNIFTVMENITDYSERQIVNGLLATFCKFYKAVLAIFMMCQNIIQEEQDNLNSQERMEAIYQNSLEEVWDQLKGIASSFHEEDYQVEMVEAKRFAADRNLLQENFHQWSPQHFIRHAIAVQLYAKQMEAQDSNALLLFPDNPEKEQDAIKIAKNLDYVITKTRKAKEGRSFSTRSIVVLMETIGYQGGTSTFLRFLDEHYPGKNLFPDLSAFSVDSRKMFMLEAKKNTADGKEKWKKCQEEAHEVTSKVDFLLHKTYSIHQMGNLPNRASAS